jgi:hypothetical protein
VPYIDPRLKEAALHNPSNVGELNFAISMLVKKFLGQDPHYDDFNGVIGCLEAAKLELYARLVRPYEDKAIVRNGDIY